MPPEFLDLPHIPVCCIQRHRDGAVTDAVGRHLFFDTSIFAVAHNNLADTVVGQAMARICQIKRCE